MLFRIDQSLLITTAIPLPISGMLSFFQVCPCSLPRVHWLLLYNGIQSERREQAFPHYKLKQFTCMFYTRKETSHWCGLQTLIRNAKERTQMSQHVKTFDPASLPQCLPVVNQRPKQVNRMAHIWKCAHLDNITCWKPVDHGWIFYCCGWLWSMKMVNLLVMTMTLMRNTCHLLSMKVNKIEGRLIHVVNAPINVTWWLKICQYSMWLFFYELTHWCCICSHGFHYWHFRCIMSMTILINVTLLPWGIMNKRKNSNYNSNTVIWRITENVIAQMWFGPISVK